MANRIGVQAVLAFSTVMAVWLVGQGALGLPAARAADEPATKRAPAEPIEPIAKEGLVPTANFFRIMQEGGVLMWPLAGCSVVCLAFVFERLISLRHSRVIPKAFVRRFLEQMREGYLDRASAAEICQKNGSPMSQVFAAAVRKWGRSEMEVEQAAIDAGERAANELRRYLRVFTALAVVAPLLGLLGTVFGMIKAFNVVSTSNALGRPELLASGISQALLNTAFGLAIAIPAQSFYFFVVGRIDRLIMDMDENALEVVQMISAEGLENRANAKQPKARRAVREAEA